MSALAELPWSWLAIRGSGVTAWVLLTCVVCAGVLLRARVLPGSPARVADAHRFLASLAVVFLGVHMLLLLVDPAVRFSVAALLVPGLAPFRPLAVALGVVAMYFLVAPVLAFGLRRRLGSAGKTLFRRSHQVAYVAWPLATAHFVLAGTDALALRLLILAGTGCVSAVLLLRSWGVPRRAARSARMS